jgi:secernin
MCDTIVATPDVTADGVMLFGKNSDREPNEAQFLYFSPAKDHPKDSRLHVTYIEIPQVSHTYSVLLSKPFWMWGAEMGFNEHGVAIGNEAVFTKISHHKEGVLLGMDLLRLGLERGGTAEEALSVITDLIAKYGQGGNCSYWNEYYYHNSYLIADPHHAWVLETAGEHWAAKRILGVYTISNGLTLNNEFDLTSSDLVYFAISMGWCQGREDFDFASCYSDDEKTKQCYSRERQCSTGAVLSTQYGNVNVSTLMNTLRNHGSDTGSNWCPDNDPSGMNVCMHTSPVNVYQTTASMVSHLHPEHPTHFATATSAPCTSIFKPIWGDVPLNFIGPEPNEFFDPRTYFWRHELLHRNTLLDYANRLESYKAERDSREARFMKEALKLAGSSQVDRAVFCRDCFVEAENSEKHWINQITHTPVIKPTRMVYRDTWDELNRQAKFNIL